MCELEDIRDLRVVRGEQLGGGTTRMPSNQRPSCLFMTARPGRARQPARGLAVRAPGAQVEEDGERNQRASQPFMMAQRRQHSAWSISTLGSAAWRWRDGGSTWPSRFQILNSFFWLHGCIIRVRSVHKNAGGILRGLFPLENSPMRPFGAREDT
jgi:hypothetical protein